MAAFNSSLTPAHLIAPVKACHAVPRRRSLTVTLSTSGWRSRPAQFGWSGHWITRTGATACSDAPDAMVSCRDHPKFPAEAAESLARSFRTHRRGTEPAGLGPVVAVTSAMTVLNSDKSSRLGLTGGFGRWNKGDSSIAHISPQKFRPSAFSNVD
jgi:hypothetical protein